MRRSQAPSMRRAAKMGAVSYELEERQVCVPSEMQWGTAGGGGLKSFRPRMYGEGENPLQAKRIFLVLWRNQSNKKHKTWKGNGTLEVTTTRATLKDEIGKVMDVLTCFRQEKIQEDALLEIGTKDVEIQVELSTMEECITQRKEEIENWYQQQAESDGLISQKDYNASRPMIILKKPKPAAEFKPTSSSSSIVKPEPVCFQLHEYICLLKPAELQINTLQVLADHSSGLEVEPHIVEIAERICDHPVLLREVVNQSFVSQFLLPLLPPWQEMGLYDSAKFEFVHQMLDNLVVTRKEKCAILANNRLCLDVIKGYCQFWEIPYILLEDSKQAECFNTPCTDSNKAPMVALLLAIKLPAIRLTCCKYMILYNYSARSAAIQLLAVNNDTQIYTLITGDCLEERKFQQHLGLVANSNTTAKDLLYGTATHKLLEVAQNALSSWNQWQPPFTESFLKKSFFTDELPNLSCVFSTQTRIEAAP